eukprot:TRINITY_DN12347_c2_g3_i1.p2 TRINITY_DN12347_c2_g3~~TRINITY_DN12347_c2_g3_i1.p2  ORF type:complete len:269 (+),score=47.14 TRINITY_DN12347_c2_g3_i1:2471-3277(+)
MASFDALKQLASMEFPTVESNIVTTASDETRIPAAEEARPPASPPEWPTIVPIPTIDSPSLRAASRPRTCTNNETATAQDDGAMISSQPHGAQPSVASAIFAQMANTNFHPTLPSIALQQQQQQQPSNVAPTQLFEAAPPPKRGKSGDRCTYNKGDIFAGTAIANPNAVAQTSISLVKNCSLATREGILNAIDRKLQTINRLRISQQPEALACMSLMVFRRMQHAHEAAPSYVMKQLAPKTGVSYKMYQRAWKEYGGKELKALPQIED